MRPSRDAGFTLMELMIVVAIIGILAAFAMPSYLRSVETSKADDSVATMNMVGTTNRMYALDHGGVYVSGYLDNSCDALGSTTVCCPGTPSCTNTTVTAPCNLVTCKYLPAMDFNSRAYLVAADNPGGAGFCNNGTFNNPACLCGGVACACVACTIRKTAGNCGNLSSGCGVNQGNYPPYTTWGYGVSTTGEIATVGTNPPAAVTP